MLNIHRFMIAAMLCTAALGACTTDRSSTAPQIQSTQDLEAYLQATPSSPLNRLSADAKQRFISSLVFTENGLGSFRYAELQALPEADVHQVLTLLGVEHATPLIIKDSAPSGFNEIEIGGDRKNMWCSSPATCSPSDGQICTDNC